ncbi:MAG: hypothetical protein U0931_25565 [Vulcanimicrobiota bacterium]
MHIQNLPATLFPQFSPPTPTPTPTHENVSLALNLPPQAQIELHGDTVTTTNDEVQLSLFEREHTRDGPQQQGGTRLGPGFQWTHHGTVRTDPNSVQRFLHPNMDSTLQVSGLVGARGEGDHRLNAAQSTENFIGAEIRLEGQHRIHGPAGDALLGAEIRASAGRTHDLSLRHEVSQERLELGADLKLEAGAGVSATPTLGLESHNGSHIKVGAELSGGEQAGIELGGGIGRDNATGETHLRLHGGAKFLLGAQANLDIAINDRDIENTAHSLGGNLLGGAGLLLGGREGAKIGREVGQELGDGAAHAITETLDNIPRFANAINRMSRDANERLSHTFDWIH